MATKPAPAAHDANAPQTVPLRQCTACCETFTNASDNPDLIKPCSFCKSDYCYDCLEELFRKAARGPGADLPRCCALIQLYTIIKRLDDDTASAYRMKLAEHVIPNKIYCPAPTCSAFIHERHVPSPRQPAKEATSMKTLLGEVMDKISLAQSARFFKDSELQNILPDYHQKVSEHIDLNTIRSRVDLNQ